MLGVDFSYKNRVSLGGGHYSYEVFQVVKDHPELNASLGRIYSADRHVAGRRGLVERRVWMWEDPAQHQYGGMALKRYGAAVELCKLHFEAMTPKVNAPRSMRPIKYVDEDTANQVYDTLLRFCGMGDPSWGRYSFVSHLKGTTSGEYRIGGLWSDKFFHGWSGFYVSTPYGYDSPVARYFSAQCNLELNRIYKEYLSGSQ